MHRVTQVVCLTRRPDRMSAAPIPCPPVLPSDKSPAIDRGGTVVVWGARAVWLAVAVLGGSAIGQALADHSRSVQRTGTTLAWIAWGVVAIALVLPSTIGLTVVRTIVPAGVVVAVAAGFGGADAVDAFVCVGLAVLAAALMASAEFGDVFVQGSAYGHERRFALRPPVGFLVATVVSWCILCASAVAGPMLLAARSWILGVVVTALAVAAGWFFGRRFHLLSRRWLVLVPAGLVVHDQLVLTDTVMLSRATLVSVGLALVDTQAADLTGPSIGHAVEVALVDAITVVLSPTRGKPSGTALHLRSMLVAPSRPGRLLRAAAAQRLPVG
jgi:hypothetical protein